MAAAEVRLPLSKMLSFKVVQITISRLCFGRCSKQLQIRLQKHDGNEQQRKSVGLITYINYHLNVTWHFRSENVTESRRFEFSSFRKT